MPLKAGEVLRDRYRVVEVLGQGGMGAVYRAEDINLGVMVAIKENLFITEQYARQFRREATILASLRHPNLPRVTDHFVIEGQGQYLVMDFVEGEDLRERVERSGAVPEKVALPWFLEVCDALAYLHSRIPPIIHRDVKPGNIRITPEGRAVLVDFGLAKIAESGTVTTTGAKAMTPGFSPPEQYGTGPTDPRTDIYSLAATLYAVLTGAIPEDALERAMGRMELTPLRMRESTISPSVARAVEKALSIRPDDRFQSVREFAAALQGALESEEGMGGYTLPLAEQDLAAEGLGPPSMRSRLEGVQDEKWRPPWSVLLGLVVLVGAIALGAMPAGRARLATLLAAPSPSPTESPTRTPPAGTPQATDTLPPPSPTPTQALVIPPPPTATPLPTPGATPVGGGVGQLAFASDRSGIPQIYLLNLDGTGLTQLTSVEDGACQPAWSPDGMRLVYTSPCRRSTEHYPGSSLWLLDLQTGEVRQLPTVIGGGDYDPAWSPDGRLLAFTSQRDRRAQIYILDLEEGEAFNLSSSPASDFQPAWDPRGVQLLFTTLRGDNSAVWFMPLSGGQAQRFTVQAERDDTHADWSHDGQFVLMERVIGGIPRAVVKPFDARERVAVQICLEGPRATQPMAEPKWSPDGNWILFETWPTGDNHEIGLISASCTNYAELTQDPAYDFDPAWRP
jgi:predicted Ser/Thr protein kinase